MMKKFTELRKNLDLVLMNMEPKLYLNSEQYDKTANTLYMNSN